MAAALRAWHELSGLRAVPELPEVEVVRAGLAPAVTGATVLGVTVLDERALTRHAGSGAHFEAALTGRRSSAPRGAASSSGFRWRPALRTAWRRRGARRPPRHERPASAARTRRRTPSGTSACGSTSSIPSTARLAVVFADQRTFGSLAIDPLIPTPDAAPGGWGTVDRVRARAGRPHRARSARPGVPRRARFRAALARKDSAIKRVLLDQTVVSGVGNIYADEALWARAHPSRDARAGAVDARRQPAARRGARGARARRSPRAARASTRST